jgi:hypothetical protein
VVTSGEVDQVMALLPPELQDQVRNSLLQRLTIGLKLREIEHRKLIAQAANLIYQYKERQVMNGIIEEKGVAWASW